MAIYQKILNMDKYYHSTNGMKLIANNLQYFNIDDQDELNKALMTVYNNDVYDMIPSCTCGLTNKYFRLGHVCRQCGDTVKERHERTDPVVWIKALDGMPQLMNPDVWYMMNISFSVKNLDSMRWLSDTSYNPPIEIPGYLSDIAEMIGGRTYSNVINNMDEILVRLLNVPTIRKSQGRVEAIEGYRKLFKRSRRDLFSEYLPILNKRLFIMENTNKGKIVNLGIADVIGLIRSYIKAANTSDSDRKKSNAIGSVLSSLSTSVNTYKRDNLYSKFGGFRKHIYGTRLPLTFRSVIVPFVGRHRYDEVKIPWVVAVTVLHPHIMNKLVNTRNVPSIVAIETLFKATRVYIPEIADILTELINDTERGIPILIHRNPTLFQGSALPVYIVGFDTTPNSFATHFSPLSVKAMNADFDGDELNAPILLDLWMADQVRPLKYHYSIPSLSKPYDVSGNLTLLPPGTDILSRYLNAEKIDIKDTLSKTYKTVAVKV